MAGVRLVKQSELQIDITTEDQNNYAFDART